MRFLCKIGIHDWKTLKSASCKCWLRTDHILSGSTVQNDLPAVTVLQKCKHCAEKNAYITEGTVCTNLNLDYVRAQPLFSEFFEEVK